MHILKTLNVSEACAKCFRCITLFIQYLQQPCEIGSHLFLQKEKP